MDDANNPAVRLSPKAGFAAARLLPPYMGGQSHCRHPGESRDPVTFAQRVYAMYRNAKASVPDIVCDCACRIANTNAESGEFRPLRVLRPWRRKSGIHAPGVARRFTTSKRQRCALVFGCAITRCCPADALPPSLS